MCNCFSRQANWGIIQNNTKFDLFFAIHDDNIVSPFLQITQSKISTSTREQLKKKIAGIYGAYQVSAKGFSVSGLDKIQLNGRQKISIIFENGEFIQNSMNIKSISNIRLKITNDLLLRQLKQDQATKLKVLASATRMREKFSICYNCLENKQNSVSMPIKTNQEFNCLKCNRELKQVKFWVCKQFPIVHTICDNCHKQAKINAEQATHRPANNGINQKEQKQIKLIDLSELMRLKQKFEQIESIQQTQYNLIGRDDPKITINQNYDRKLNPQNSGQDKKHETEQFFFVQSDVIIQEP